MSYLDPKYGSYLEPRYPSEGEAPDTSERLSVGIAGLGYWGPNLLRVLSDMPGIEVRWICDLNLSRLARFGRRYPAVGTTASFQDLLDDDQLDAVVIATPVFTHVDLCAQSLGVSQCGIHRRLRTGVGLQQGFGALERNFSILQLRLELIHNSLLGLQISLERRLL